MKIQDQVEERDREVSGLKLELRSVKMQLDKSDIEIVELNNLIEELRRSSSQTANSKQDRSRQDISMVTSKRFEEVCDIAIAESCYANERRKLCVSRMRLESSKTSLQRAQSHRRERYVIN